MSSTQHQLIEQCATRLRGIVEALDNIHDTSPHRWSTDLDDVHSSAESLLALINDQAPTQAAQGLAGAALAQPSPVRSSLLINGYQLRAALDFIAPDGTAEQLKSEACIEWRQQDADFLEAGLYAFCAEYPEEGGVLLDEEPTTAQPSPLQSEQAEAERPEVVARVVHSNPVVLGQCGPLNANDELMTVAQHAASVARWAEMFNRVEQQRDAALARVAGLEAKLGKLEKHEPVAVVKGDGSLGAGFPSGAKLYAAPVAQAQQLNDLDKQCRDDVARALGLRPNQERGFAWSYLLASIKSCVKASGDSAQAQHSVPEEFSFEYRHPNGESHTVTVSRDQVINEMPDFLFEALCSKFCNCEPAGETNVVECCCDEYAEEFKLLAAAPGNSAQHSVPEGWKLVPVDPTEDLLEAIHNGGYVGDDRELRQFYQAILDAAPAPGGE
ncbi:hypothetical protein [Pseudomonas aeruginosa]|uniref:hypothetical protein n=1 Tax=Pseudomonas aeruginosa TaxID=287 RepID=UPI002096C074|nr:hypothetical protein [Pseudomonas aeruginosa]MCO7708890.1 hypothetical protein [Pseudomonas aeruginosa]MCO7714756.1 hypothetical protein [Pseudomonas aeruginosa]MCO7720605.1 hypothetical protein [Pseudomonas aeruginosa]MCO7734023.1 hypothetical protein [Pseudomonas aeruginosa]MCO7754145.1 hypothetical protein [Pseudomonas aeruginosa]